MCYVMPIVQSNIFLTVNKHKWHLKGIRTVIRLPAWIFSSNLLMSLRLMPYSVMSCLLRHKQVCLHQQIKTIFDEYWHYYVASCLQKVFRVFGCCHNASKQFVISCLLYNQTDFWLSTNTTDIWCVSVITQFPACCIFFNVIGWHIWC